MTKSRRMLIGGALAFVMVTSTIAAPADSFVSSIVSVEASAKDFFGRVDLDSECSVRFVNSSNRFKHTGKLIKPKVKVKIRENDVILDDSEYIVSYEENLEVGRGVVHITAVNDSKVCKGTTTKYFYILPSLNTPTLSKPKVENKSNKLSITGTVTVPSGFENIRLWVGREGFDIGDWNNNNALGDVRVSASGVTSKSKTIQGCPGLEITGAKGKTINYTITGVAPGTNYVICSEAFVEYENGNSKTSTLESDTKKVTVKSSDSVDMRDVEIAAIRDQKYTGKEIKPLIKLTIKDGKTTKTIPNACYTVSYMNNVEPGVATIIVKPTGKGSIKLTGGQIRTSFNILNGKFPKITISESKGNTTYTWKNTSKRSDIVMIVKSGTKCAYAREISAGSTSTTISKTDLRALPEGKYTVCFYYVSDTYPIYSAQDERGIFFKWAENAVGTNVFSGSGIRLEGAGSPTSLSLTVKDDESEKATINVNDVKLNAESFAYTGKAIKPVVTIESNFLGIPTSSLKQGIDFTVTYKNNVKVGEGSVIVKGKGKFTGSVTVPFDITPADIAYATVAPIKDQTYTGKLIMPTLSITYNGKKLVQNVDYVVDNGSNTKPGTGTVYINGKGNYGGSQKVTFKIVKAQAKITAVTVDRASLKEELTRFSEAQRSGRRYAVCPKVTVKAGSKVLNQGTDYTIGFSNNESTGTAKVTITGKGDYTGTKTVSFKISITKPKMTDASISVDESALKKSVEAVKNGSAKKVTAEVTVKYRGITLKEGTDYTVSCTRNSRKGTVKVTVRGKGNYMGSKSLTFKM